MLYLDNIARPQQVYIPRSGGGSQEGPLVLRLFSTMDLDEVISQEVEDMGTSVLYYAFSLVLPDGLDNGEYEYTLCAGASVLSTGMLVIGDYSGPREYETSVAYEQYEN